MRVTFYSGKMKTVAGRTAFQTALRSFSKEAEGKVRMQFWGRECTCSQAHTFFFCRKFLLVTRSTITTKDFRAF